MENVFLLGEGERSAFLQHMIQSSGCTYICLWSYLPQPSSCLLYLDGIFREVGSQQPSSSSGSLARRHFNTYCESVNFMDNGRIPGFAFKNNVPYMELKLYDFRRMASTQHQLQFYQEAGIQTVVFMGCAMGEIELGMSVDPKVDIEMEMRNWFPIDFSQQDQLMPHQPLDQKQPPSSSSSSLRSLSMDSPEYSPLLFNIPTTSTSLFVPEPAKESLIGEALLEETLKSSVPPSITTSGSPQQQAIHALSQIRSVQLPTIESEDTVITRAILSVLSSPSITSPSASHQNFSSVSNNKTTTFRRFEAALAPVARVSSRKHNMFRRAIGFFRNLYWTRRQELQIQGNRPTSTQLHHMISERRRREKLNESFQILRSFLPPGSKKDKASVLSNTTEYLSSLKSQVEELKKRNETLESELFMTRQKDQSEGVGGGQSSSSSTKHDHHMRVSVEIENNVAASSTSSEGRVLDLRVRVRGECNTLDLVIRILEFLNRQRNVSLLSMESSTRMIHTSTQEHGILLRLKVEGDEFDETGFQEAVRRVADDLAH